MAKATAKKAAKKVSAPSKKTMAPMTSMKKGKC